MRTLLWVKLLGLIIAMGLIFGGGQQAPASSKNKNSERRGPLIIRPAQSGVSKPAWWVAQHSKELVPPMSEAERKLHEELMRILPLPVPREKLRPHYKPSSTMLPTRVPLALSPKSAISAPPPGGSFEGLNNYDNIIGGIGFQVVPPDVNGDVGPNHYVEFVNLVMRVYDKNGNPLSAPFPLSALFASAGFPGPCATNNNGDPIVLYDQFADRWFLSQFYIRDARNNTGPSHHCIAISQTGDPLGPYYLYDFVWPDFPAGSGTHIFMDYPHHAIWPNAYWMTAHEFDLIGTQCPFIYCAQAVVALERNKMLAGDPTAQMIYFGVMNPPPSGVDLTTVVGVLAADIEGPTPIPNIAGQPAPGIFLEWIADEWGAPADAINVYKFIVDWANPAASDFVLATTIPVAPFNPLHPSGRNHIPQPGVSTSSYLESISEVFMHRIVIRNMGSYSLIGANHTVCAPGLSNTQCQTAGQYQAAIRWYILNYDNSTGNVTLADQGTYTGNPPDTHSRWMASVTFDKYGDFCVSYTVSSTTVYPSIRYACRTPADTPGTLGPEAELQAGSASQTTSTGRWGDYSMISIDPTDDCTFWPIHEYYTTTNPAGCSSLACWHTRFGFFRLPACGGVTTGGTGIEPPTLSVVSTNFVGQLGGVDFGDVAMNTQKGPAIIKIESKNPIFISGIRINEFRVPSILQGTIGFFGGLFGLKEQGGSFILDPNAGDRPCGSTSFNLAGYCTVGVIFQPKSEGKKQAYLEVYYNQPYPVKVYITGTGISQQQAPPSGGSGGSSGGGSGGSSAGVSSSGGGGGCSMGGSASGVNALGWLLLPAFALVRRLRRR